MKQDDYEDIINLPHHTSAKHPRMSIGDRAAQFASFAALTGFEGCIDDAGEAHVRAYDTRLGDEYMEDYPDIAIFDGKNEEL